MSVDGIVGELESARVTRLLREEIVMGERVPGSRLIERDIAEKLSVSRLPVREAIRTLEAEGIVVTRPRTWAVVREFSQHDIAEFSEVREAIETLLFVLAAERHDGAGLARLRAVVDREEAAAKANDSIGARTASAEFHTLVAELAGNARFNEIVSAFSTRIQLLFGQHRDLEEMVGEHRELLEVIAARDLVTLRMMVPRHLTAGRMLAEERLGLAQTA